MSNPSVNKRLKERARAERKQEKAAKRKEKRDRPRTAADAADGEDPDLAGIVPGPQGEPPVD
jgi:hypothetical protein